MTGVYRIADVNIEIHSIYPAVHSYCRNYASDGIPELVIESVPEDIEYERRKSVREAEAEGRPVRDYPDDYLEELAVYRHICEKMPIYDTILFHGSAVSVDGIAYLFTAPSGTGKSTHTRLWRELFGDRALMINDDKPLIRTHAEGPPIVFGTPYDGKHRLSCNAAVPLRAVCLLERSASNHIRSADAQELYPALLAQIYRPADRSAAIRTLELFDRMLHMVKLFRLSCNMKMEAAQIAYEAMRRSEIT